MVGWAVRPWVIPPVAHRSRPFDSSRGPPGADVAWVTEQLLTSPDGRQADSLDLATTTHHDDIAPAEPATRGASRRHLLLAPVVVAATSACSKAEVAAWVRYLKAHPKPPTVPPTTAPPTTAPPTTVPPGPTATVSAEVAVNKLTFGNKPGLVDHVRAMGVGAWIDQQLAPWSLTDAEGMVASYSSLTNSNLQNYDLAQTDGGGDRIVKELDYATILRAVHSDRQLFELMCDFWNNHFNTWRGHTWMGFLKNKDHHDVVRANALGKFSDMLVASTHSVAMLDYLDNLPNDASTPGGVNENYARELMELHTLGIIAGQHVYTEEDVHGLAKLISGWSIKWDDGPDKYTFMFAPWQHSLDPVSLLGGTFTRPARSYGDGYQDAVDFIDVLAHHPSTARYICWKLVKRFVADDPPMTLVDSAAAVFRANDTAIVPTLRHIFLSAEFAASGGSKVRRPFEYAVAALRATGASVGTDPIGNSSDDLRWALDNLGQPLYEWATPDGYPDLAAYWVSSAGLLERWDFAGALARNALSDQGQADKVSVNLASLLPSPLPATVADLVTWMATNLANFAISAQDVTDLCTAAVLTPSAAATTLSTSASKLAFVVGLIISHPSFQRR